MLFKVIYGQHAGRIGTISYQADPFKVLVLFCPVGTRESFMVAFSDIIEYNT